VLKGILLNEFFSILIDVFSRVFSILNPLDVLWVYIERLVPSFENKELSRFVIFAKLILNPFLSLRLYISSFITEFLYFTPIYNAVYRV
jgi:hypothetical protein